MSEFTATTQNAGFDNLVVQQYYLQCLSQASYLVGDRSSGNAVVVDPRRDVDEYLDDAATAGLTITHVIETHFHADFLSGHLEIAERTGAAIVYGEAALGRVEFPVLGLSDGQRIDLGRVQLEIRATPGHTPESVSIVIYPDAGVEPYGVLTGDTLFIGDVGRPDLLVAAGVTADDLARQLYASLHEQLMTLPDGTKVFPAHGAGSACGKQLSAETVSTIGEQRRTNYALAPMTEDQFVDVVTEGQPSAPMYFSYAANRNREAHATLDEDAAVTALDLGEVVARQADGAVVVDGRDNTSFAAGHLRGSINVGMEGRFAEYVGEVVPAGSSIVVVTDPEHEQEAVVRLARIGFDDVLGSLAQPTVAFAGRPELIEQASRLTAAQLAARRVDLDDVQLVDVRNDAEVADGILDGAIHIPLAGLVRRLSELDPTRPTVVYCAGGYRSSIAASTLRANGFSDVSDVIGGYQAVQLSREPGS